MLLKFPILLNLKCLIIVLVMTTCKCDLQQGFTTRCDELCGSDGDKVLQNDVKPDCQRGCQYFNIQFFINASNKSKVIDLTTTKNQCELSCTEAYVQFIKKDACTEGCKRMKDLQSKAPYMNGWLVYMGTADRSMVIIQPDFDIKNNNWTSLDTEYRLQEYEKQISFYQNYFTNFVEQTNDRLAKTLKNINLTSCFSTCQWTIIILSLLLILLLRYVPLFSFASTLSSFGSNDKMNLSEISIDHYVIKYNYDDDKKKLSNDNNFNVCNETYFYPTPAVPPPKCDEAIEAMLMHGADAENSATV